MQKNAKKNKVYYNRNYLQCLISNVISVFFSSIQIRKFATFNSDSKIINLIPNKSFRCYKL